MNNQKRNYAMTLIGKPRTHSYGFAQAYLGGRDDVRLHLFTGTICAVACIPEQVPIRHNHRYDFKSKTLKGIIVDKPCLIHPRWECGG